MESYLQKRFVHPLKETPLIVAIKKYPALSTLTLIGVTTFFLIYLEFRRFLRIITVNKKMAIIEERINKALTKINLPIDQHSPTPRFSKPSFLKPGFRRSRSCPPHYLNNLSANQHNNIYYSPHNDAIDLLNLEDGFSDLYKEFNDCLKDLDNTNNKISNIKNNGE